LVKQNKVELKEVVKGTDNLYGDKANMALNEYRQELLNKYGNGIRNKATPEELAKLDELDNRTTLSNPNPTKYHDYQLPGGSNYQEMLLTLPDRRTARMQYLESEAGKRRLTGDELSEFQSYNKDDLNQYKSSHWEEPNILAHVRYNDRDIPDVGKSLHLEEIQSDWHQAGRKQGYKNQELENSVNKIINEKLEPNKQWLSPNIVINGKIEPTNITDMNIQHWKKEGILSSSEAETLLNANKIKSSGVPDAPFKKSWDELAFKRMLNKAANEGYDSISWTPGEAQAARYDLSKQLDKVNLIPDPSGKFRIDAFKDNKKVIEHYAKDEKEVADIVGKEVAEKLFKNRNQHGAATAAGLDLKIGGEGMKSFYDKMLVDKANALAKKYGAKVETKTLSDTTKNFKIKSDPIAGGFEITKDGKTVHRSPTRESAQAWVAEHGSQPVHVLKLTPELRAKAKEGFPLFSFSPTTIPVDYDPWKDNTKRNITLVPVPYDPFK